MQYQQIHMYVVSHYLFCKFIAQLTIVSGWIWGRSQKCNFKCYGDRGRGWIDLLVTKRQTTVSQREPSELDYVMLFSCWGFKLCRYLLIFFFPSCFIIFLSLKGDARGSGIYPTSWPVVETSEQTSKCEIIIHVICNSNYLKACRINWGVGVKPIQLLLCFI